MDKVQEPNNDLAVRASAPLSTLLVRAGPGAVAAISREQGAWSCVGLVRDIVFRIMYCCSADRGGKQGNAGTFLRVRMAAAVPSPMARVTTAGWVGLDFPPHA